MLRTLILFALLSAPTVAAAAELTLTIENIRNDRGKVRVAIYADSDSFLQKGREIAARQSDAATGTMVLHFQALVADTFAVALHHDEDDDGQVDTNLFGIPTEGVGFSNNVTGIFGPPVFSDAMVTITRGDDNALTIRLN